jgi:hypothetical protein
MQNVIGSQHVVHVRTASLRDGSQIYVSKSRIAEMPAIQFQVQSEIGASVADLPTMLQFFHRNSDSFWSIREASTQDRRGCILFLFPRRECLEAICTHRMDMTRPDPTLFARTGERPGAVYIWAVVARRMAREALALVAQELSPQLYGAIPIYTRAGSLGGLNALVSSGSASLDAPQLGGLFQMPAP